VWKHKHLPQLSAAVAGTAVVGTVVVADGTEADGTEAAGAAAAGTAADGAEVAGAEADGTEVVGGGESQHICTVEARAIDDASVARFLSGSSPRGPALVVFVTGDGCKSL
jgi:hypothetical protein